MIDFTKLLKQIVPDQDGPSPLFRRKATVLAVNGDGTINIDLNGVTISSVPVIAGAQVAIGARVQLLAERGDLLALGKVGAGVAPPTVWPNAQIDFGAAIIPNTTLTDLVPTSVPFDPNPVYPGSGSVFTIPSGQGGLYSYGAHLRFPVQATATGYRQIRMVVNGVERSIFQEVADSSYNNLSVPVNGGSRAVLAAGSTIIFRVQQTSGVSATLIGTGNIGWIQRIG